MRFGRRAAWGAVGVALGLASSGVAVLAVPKPPMPDFMGHVVMAPVTVAPAGPTFEVRHNCRIARFGVAPWAPPGSKKDSRWEQMTRLWLSSVGMPAAGHDGAIELLRAPAPGGVDLSNTSGAFDTTYRVGNRYVSCLQSQTRFTSDSQVEPAEFYPYVFGGKTWRLAIIKRCGNVTLLPPVVIAPPVIMPPAAAAPPAAGVGPALPPGLGGIPPYGVVPPVVTDPRGGGISPAPFPLPGGPVHEVPEPGSLGLMLAALGALLWRKK